MNAIITKNPWFKPQSAYSRREYRYEGKPLAEHRGVQVFKNSAGSWDWVISGMTVGQRAGFHKDRFAAAMDELLDGKWPCAQAVAEHLRFHGFGAVSHEEYVEPSERKEGGA